MSRFRDHFAFASESYASFRPDYPASLFDWLDRLTPRHERAWDCGTGTGQAAVALARHYGEVIATDPSLRQLANAARADGVHYAAMSAHPAALASHSVDLVTVAQALHWFDLPRFFGEVDRVLRPGGILAVWSYGLLTIDPATDAELRHLYRDILGSYWPTERVLVDSGYVGIVLPYPELSGPDVSMEATWSLRQVAGYLSTWSAVGRYRQALARDPLPEVMRRIELAWPAGETRQVRWPLVARAARKSL
jgi:SAM-dependent methyltransferase